MLESSVEHLFAAGTGRDAERRQAALLLRAYVTRLIAETKPRPLLLQGGGAEGRLQRVGAAETEMRGGAPAPRPRRG